MSTLYSVALPVPLSDVERATNGAIQFKQYPYAEYRSMSGLLTFAGDVYEIELQGDEITGVVDRYDGDLDALEAELRKHFDGDDAEGTFWFERADDEDED